MSRFKTGIICFIAGVIISGILCIYLTKKYWPTEITIESTQTGDTVHNKPEIIHVKPENTQENYDYTYNCTISSILVENRIEDNIIYGIAYDACKSARFQIKLSTKPIYKHTIQASYIFQLQAGSSIKASYFYNINLLSVGGGIIFNKEYPGIEISVQKSF